MEYVALDQCPHFDAHISVFHSAVARFYSPSDTCGAGGMYRERIRSNPNWHRAYGRYDTVFVETDPDLQGMPGMVIARVFLFFSFTWRDRIYPCALVHWYSQVTDHPDPETGMWVVQPEYDGNNRRTQAVIHLDSIARGAHLIGVYGTAKVPDELRFSDSLDVFRSYFVNRFADHHTHEFI